VIYELIQSVVGVTSVNRRLERQLETMEEVGWVLDVGAGTGRDSRRWKGARYIAMDADPVKLSAFREESGAVIRGDAVRLPIQAGRVDVILFKNVSHHLRDSELAQFVREAARVLNSDGRLIFIDALWCPRRWRAQMLWRFDRGSHPRTEEQLRSALARSFQLVVWERFSVHHEYVLAIGRPDETAVDS
jgi:SAM-dependent methyltransferase